MGAMKRLQCKKGVCSVKFHSMKCFSIAWSRNSIPVTLNDASLYLVLLLWLGIMKTLLLL